MIFVWQSENSVKWYNSNDFTTNDDGDIKSKSFDIICPDEGRVHLHGEVIEEN